MFSDVLRRDGFACIDQLLSTERVRELIHRIESLPADSEAARTRRGAPFARRNLLEVDFIAALASDSAVTSIVDEIAPGSIPVRAILFDKTKHANWTVPWHQDRSIAVRERTDSEGYGPWSVKAGVVHVQPPIDVLRAMVTVRIHLDACGGECGPLRVVPRTHDRILSEREVAEQVERASPIACVVGAGGAVLMRPLILHSSSPAERPNHRRVIHIEYGPRELPGGVQWAVATAGAAT